MFKNTVMLRTELEKIYCKWKGTQIHYPLGSKHPSAFHELISEVMFPQPLSHGQHIRKRQNSCRITASSSQLTLPFSEKYGEPHILSISSNASTAIYFSTFCLSLRFAISLPVLLKEAKQKESVISHANDISLYHCNIVCLRKTK